MEETYLRKEGTDAGRKASLNPSESNTEGLSQGQIEQTETKTNPQTKATLADIVTRIICLIIVLLILYIIFIYSDLPIRQTISQLFQLLGRH